MSDRVRALIWDYYSQKRFGAPRILAITLSDEADDRGGGIFQSIKELARKSEQTERAVRKQMHSLQQKGLVECIERSPGGPGQFNHYRINLPVLLAVQNTDQRSGLTLINDQGSMVSNPDPKSGLGDPSIYKESKELLRTDAAAFRVADDAEDHRLAAWMLERIRALNPNHREPSWPAWCKDIRRMRIYDKRTRKDIAALFAWANGDSFWQANILSPGTLRRQWDRLELQRRRNGGSVQALRQDGDIRCSWDKGGTRCVDEGVFGHPDGKRYCRKHEEEQERERAT